MERIKQILMEQLNTELLQIVLSDPRKKPETFGNAQDMEKDKALLASKVKDQTGSEEGQAVFPNDKLCGDAGVSC